MSESARNNRRVLEKNTAAALIAFGAYITIYLIGRILWCDIRTSTFLGWLLWADPQGAHSYLYGWLTHKNIFWIAAAVSVIPAFFGKHKFSAVTFAYFLIGLVVGIILGPTEYGTGEYGAAYWCSIFFLSLPTGLVLEKVTNNGFSLRTQKGIVITAFVVLSLLLMILFVQWQIPDWKMP